MDVILISMPPRFCADQGPGHGQGQVKTNVSPTHTHHAIQGTIDPRSVLLEDDLVIIILVLARIPGIEGWPVPGIREPIFVNVTHY